MTQLVTGQREIVAGSDIQLYCEAQSDHTAPNIEWNKDGVMLQNRLPSIYFRTSVDVTNASSGLTIRDFRVRMMGCSYSCVASIPADGGGTIT